MGRQQIDRIATHSMKKRENTVCWSVVIHTGKGFGVVDEAEVDAFSGILLLFL